MSRSLRFVLTRPLLVAGFLVWLSMGPMFLDPSPWPSVPAWKPSAVRLSWTQALEDADEIVIMDRGGVIVRGPGEDEPEFVDRDFAVEPDDAILRPAGEPSGATGGTAIGVARVGHFGTGKPSAFVSRRSGGGGHGGGGMGQGGGGGAGGSAFSSHTFGGSGRLRGLAAMNQIAPGALIACRDVNVAPLVFPLTCTVASAELTGWFASTRMTQTFTNPLDEPLSADYLFPMPTTSAVSDFEMRIGSRLVVGVVRRRAEVRALYDAAIARGKTATLLDQERVNLFTQRVGNIAPRSSIDVTVTYFHPLAYDDGAFEYVFPMTVGSRYSPASMDPAAAAAVQTPVIPASVRSGREVAIHAVLDAGAEIDDISSPTHAVVVNREGRQRAVVDLARKDEVANRDFVLRWRVAATAMRAGCVAHRAPDGTGYFSALLVPPLENEAPEAGPREVTFLLDASGSMDGAPFETLRRFSARALRGLRRSDRLNLIRFGGTVDSFGDAAVDATPSNVDRAVAWLDGLTVGGGTDMLPAVQTFAAQATDRRWQRIVGFVTDGRVGNEDQILSAIREQRGDARWFSFGIGSSVNRAFIEGVALEGRGSFHVVLPGETAAAETAAERCLTRIDAPVLQNVRFDPNGLPIQYVTPSSLPDLFVGQPLFVLGRYTEAAEGDVYFRGTAGGREVTIACHVVLPDIAPSREALAPMWARQRIGDFTSQMLDAPQEMRATLAEKIEETALNYHLASASTSFVAVDEDSQVSGGAVHVVQPVEQPADTR